MTANATVPVEPRYFASGPEGAFWANDMALAEAIIRKSKYSDDWTITDLHEAAAPQPEATQEVEQVARELLAASMGVSLEHLGTPENDAYVSELVAFNAIVAALTRNPQPVDLGQFREAVNHARMRADSIEQYGRFDALLALIDRQPGDVS